MARHKRWLIGERGPRPVDAHVGGRVRMRRTILGMSQTNLAESLGLSFQQVQKYESGMNRIGSSRLWELSGVLDVPVIYFFEGLEAGNSEDVSAKTETLKLVRAYYRIKNDKVRKRLYELVMAAAKAGD